MAHDGSAPRWLVRASVVVAAATASLSVASPTTSDPGGPRAASGTLTLRAGEVVTAAERVETVAAEVLTRAGRVAVEAERVVEHAGDVYRRVDGLAELQAGRTRTLVEGACQMIAGRTSITSNEDTVVDGARVLLG